MRCFTASDLSLLEHGSEDEEDEEEGDEDESDHAINEDMQRTKSDSSR